MIDKFCMDVVHGCQLRCVGCPNSTLNRGPIQFITPEFFNKCLSNVDVDYIRIFRTFVFGEPMLHPELSDVLAEIPKQKFKVQEVELSTNAQKLSNLLEIVRQGIVTRLVISADGNGTPEDYERLRPPATWERLMEFLVLSSHYRHKYNPSLKIITRNICSTKDGMHRWKKILLPLGIKPGFRVMRKDPDSLYAQGKKIRSIKGACECLRRSRFYVDADGTVIPCCAHPRAAVLGNLAVSKYSEIRDGARKTFANKLRNRKSVPICERCELK